MVENKHIKGKCGTMSRKNAMYDRRSVYMRGVNLKYRKYCAVQIGHVERLLEPIRTDKAHIECCLTRLQMLAPHLDTLSPQTLKQKFKETECNLANHMLLTSDDRDIVCSAWEILKYRCTYVRWLRTLCGREFQRLTSKVRRR